MPYRNRASRKRLSDRAKLRLAVLLGLLGLVLFTLLVTGVGDASAQQPAEPSDPSAPPAPEGGNPFQLVRPIYDWFGPMQNKLIFLFGVGWGIAILYTGYKFVTAFLAGADAHRHGYSEDFSVGRQRAKSAGLDVLIALGSGLILNTLVWLMG